MCSYILQFQMSVCRSQTQLVPTKLPLVVCRQKPVASTWFWFETFQMSGVSILLTCWASPTKATSFQWRCHNASFSWCYHSFRLRLDETFLVGCLSGYWKMSVGHYFRWVCLFCNYSTWEEILKAYLAFDSYNTLSFWLWILLSWF